MLHAVLRILKDAMAFNPYLVFEPEEKGWGRWRHRDARGLLWLPDAVLYDKSPCLFTRRGDLSWESAKVYCDSHSRSSKMDVVWIHWLCPEA